MEDEFFSFNLRLKMTSWVCLVVSELKTNFYCVAQLLILSKSLLRLFAEVWMLCITETKKYHLQKLCISWKAFCQIIKEN